MNRRKSVDHSICSVANVSLYWSEFQFVRKAGYMSDSPQDTRQTPRAPGNQVPPISIAQSVAERIAQTVSQVIFGKRNEVRLAVLGLLSRGHILIEDIPGVGK